MKLPNNPDTEKALLGTLLVDNDQIQTVSEIVEQDDFYVTNNQRVYAVILDLYRAGTPADLTTVFAAVQKSGIKATDLADLCSDLVISGSAVSYAHIVRGLAIRRRLILHAKKIEAIAHQADTAETAVEQAQGLINNVCVSSAGKACSFREISVESFSRYELARANAGKISGVPTGYRHLDWLLCGMNAGDLLVLAARPSMGKSAIAGNICANAARAGYASVVFSLEMTKERWFDRVASSRSGVPANRFRNGMFSPEDWQSLAEANDELYRLPIWVDDTGRLPVGEVCRRARGAVAVNGARLIVIDHLQIMLGKDQRTRDREIGDITGQLKGLAKTTSCPVLLLSQLNRSVEQRDNKRPMLSDLRDSGNIEQDADVVMFLFREAYYLEKAKTHLDQAGNETERYQRVKNVAELDIAKQREGPTGTVPLFWQAKTTTFTEVENDQ